MNEEILKELVAEVRDEIYNLRTIKDSLQKLQDHFVRPFVILRPELTFKDCRYVFSYGNTTGQSIITGYGKTPKEASEEFDRCFYSLGVRES